MTVYPNLRSWPISWCWGKSATRIWPSESGRWTSPSMSVRLKVPTGNCNFTAMFIAPFCSMGPNTPDSSVCHSSSWPGGGEGTETPTAINVPAPRRGPGPDALTANQAAQDLHEVSSAFHASTFFRSVLTAGLKKKNFFGPSCREPSTMPGGSRGMYPRFKSKLLSSSSKLIFASCLR